MQTIFDLLYLLSEFVLIIGLPILLLLSLFRRLRKYTGLLIIISSILFGITIWFLCVMITYAYWNIIVLIIGIVFFGIGVIPLALLASLIEKNWLALGLIVVGIIITYLTTTLGMYIKNKAKTKQ